MSEFNVVPVRKASSPAWERFRNASTAQGLGWWLEVSLRLSGKGWLAHAKAGDSDDWVLIGDTYATQDQAELAADAWLVRQAMEWAGLEVRK
jgi:hypothetical protein